MKSAAASGGTIAQVPQPNLGAAAQSTTPVPPPPPPITAPPAQADAGPAAAAASPDAGAGGAGAGGRASFLMNSPGPVAAGSSFQVPVVISGANDIASVPMQLQYDASKLSLVNVESGDFLSRDGQAIALVHRDDGPGNVTINASRPPGSAGVNGAGVVCVLTFQAKAPGDSNVTITRPGALNSKQQPVLAQGTELTVSVK